MNNNILYDEMMRKNMESLRKYINELILHQIKDEMKLGRNPCGEIELSIDMCPSTHRIKHAVDVF